MKSGSGVYVGMEAPAEPRIGKPLPNTSSALIPRRKLVEYVLNPTHDLGGPKARVFASVLGIERDDWSYLRDAILGALSEYPVTGSREPGRPQGVRTWEVRVRVDGLNGRAAWIITAWRIDDSRPILVSARVGPKARQEPGESVRWEV